MITKPGIIRIDESQRIFVDGFNFAEPFQGSCTLEALNYAKDIIATSIAKHEKDLAANLVLPNSLLHH